jgi:hypothetical protein
MHPKFHEKIISDMFLYFESRLSNSIDLFITRNNIIKSSVIPPKSLIKKKLFSEKEIVNVEQALVEQLTQLRSAAVNEAIKDEKGAEKSIAALEKEFLKFESEFVNEIQKDVNELENVIEKDEKIIEKDIKSIFGFK